MPCLHKRTRTEGTRRPTETLFSLTSLCDIFNYSQEKSIIVDLQQSLQDVDLVNNQDLLLKPKGQAIVRLCKKAGL